MASETELEKLVVRITADNAQILKTLQSTIGAVQSFATKTLGILGIAMSVKGFLGLAKSAEAAELKIKQLEIAIRVNGHAVASTVAEYRAFAEQVARSTTLTKGETLGMLKQAEVMGFSGKEAEAIVKNSIALAGALGGEASEHEHLAVALARGNFNLVKRALHMKHTATDAEVLAQVEKTLNAGLEQSIAAGNTNEASLARLGKTFDVLKNKIGGIIAEGLHPFLGLLEDLQTEYKNVEGQSMSTWDNARNHVKMWAEGAVFAIKYFSVFARDLGTNIAYQFVKMLNIWSSALKTFINEYASFTGFKFRDTGGILTEDEKGLKEELGRTGQALLTAFDEFQAKNKSKFEKIGRKTGEGIGKGIQKGLGMEKIEGTLAFSLEGLQKITQFFATGRIGESKADANHRESLTEAKKQTELLKGVVNGIASGSAGIGL